MVSLPLLRSRWLWRQHTVRRRENGSQELWWLRDNCADGRYVRQWRSRLRYNAPQLPLLRDAGLFRRAQPALRGTASARPASNSVVVGPRASVSPRIRTTAAAVAHAAARARPARPVGASALERVTPPAAPTAVPTPARTPSTAPVASPPTAAQRARRAPAEPATHAQPTESSAGPARLRYVRIRGPIRVSAGSAGRHAQ